MRSKSMLNKLVLASLLSCALFPWMENAADAAKTEAGMSSFNLDEIIVTATATPVNSQMKTNAAVTVITREDIEAKHYTNIVDILESVPGVTTMTPANGIGFEVSGYAQPGMRGIMKVVLLIDGVKQDFGGRTYSANLLRNVADVERIEILRGTNSVLYGSEAVGGVINIITRKHYDAVKTRLSASFGNFSARNFQLDNYGQSGKSFWSVTALTNHQGNYKDGHGRVRPQDADISEIDLKYGIHMDEQNDLIFKYTKHHQDQDYVEGRGYGKDAPGHSQSPRYTTYTGIWNLHSKQPGKWENSLSVYRGENYNDRWLAPYINGKGALAKAWSEKSKARTVSIQDNYYNQLTKNNRISAGFGYVYRAYTAATYLNSHPSVKEKSFYLQDEWDITKRLKLTVGARYTAFDDMKNKFMPGVTLGYSFGDKAMVYASSQGYMMYPDFARIVGATLANYSFAANPGLKPQTGRTNEVGAKFRLGNKTYFDVAMYDRRQKDSIVGEIVGTDSRGKPLYKYSNADEPVHIKGIEASLRQKFGKYVTATVSYSHIRPEEESNIPNVAKDSYNFDLRYTKEKFNFGLSGMGRRNIQRSDAVRKADMKLPCPSYWIWNVYGNYKVNKNLKLWGKVNNIFDRHYIYTPELDTTGKAVYGYTDFRYYSKPGRSFMLGVEYTF